MKKILTAYVHPCPTPAPTKTDKNNVVMCNRALHFPVGENLLDTIICSICKREIRKGVVTIGELREENKTV